MKAIGLKGKTIICESATSDYGMTNDPTKWWGFRTHPYERIPYNAAMKAIKTIPYKVIQGGFSNGKCINAITTIKFCD